MGITGLNKLLRPLSRDVDARDYAQLAAGVDGSAWLHRAYWGAVAEGVDEPAELEARVCAYFEKYAAVLATELDVAVTVVFDGAPPAQKRAKTLKGTAGNLKAVVKFDMVMEISKSGAEKNDGGGI